MEERVEALEKEVVRLGECIKFREEAHRIMANCMAGTVLWFDNVVISLSSKGVLDGGDLDAIRDTKEELEQFRGDVHREKLLQQADEEKPQ